MEEENIKTMAKQQKSSYFTMKPYSLHSTIKTPRSTAPNVLSENNRTSCSANVIRNGVDKHKVLKRVPDMIKKSLKDLRANNKENHQQKVNSIIAKCRSKDHSLAERTESNHKSQRHSQLADMSQSLDIKHLLNGRRGSENKLKVSPGNSHKVSAKPNSHLVPNIHELPIKEDIDNSFSSHQVEEDIDINKMVSETPANIEQNLDDRNIEVEITNVPKPVINQLTNGNIASKVSLDTSVLDSFLNNQPVEQDVSDIIPKKLGLNLAEETFLSADTHKNKSILAETSRNHTFMTAKTDVSANDQLTYNLKTRMVSDFGHTNTGSEVVPHNPKSNNEVKIVSANTNRGSFRNYNEDRISIVLNIKGKNDSKYNYFGVFDGHAGNNCSEFLKDTLHKYIIPQKNLFEDFEANISKTFRIVDELFKETAVPNKDKSGSCALTMFSNKSEIFFANVGDSRAIASLRNGREVRQLTIDHKPENPSEKERVFENGGYFYATNTVILKENERKTINGPLRVFPGRLTTTRSFGDFEAKLPQCGGLEGVVISEPEFSSYETDDFDFIILGCDGLYENITNEEIMGFVHKELNLLRKKKKPLTKLFSDSLAKKIVDFVIENGSSDNVSAVLVFFDKFVNTFEGEIH